MFFFRVLVWIACRLSRRGAARVGAALGLLWHALIPVRRRHVRASIRACLGYDTRTARQVARRVYRNLGVNALEFLRLPLLRDPRAVKDFIDTRELTKVDALLARGRGLLVLTAHFGNWELLAASQALAGYEIAVVTKTMKATRINAFWMKHRAQTGLSLLPASGSGRALIETLKRGASVGFVLDQHTPGGVVVDFFGRPAATTSGLARLHEISGAPLVPAFLVRTDLCSHRILIGDEIPFTREATREQTVCTMTQKYTHALEAMVRAHPDQWLWLHRRWKVV
ncbi:MAG: lysophospholipid acyltransferase family protein [Deltaproteobacteria bacterium]|nr:lysophospholipid acyltransferase family protein [Deltaproteobacteria bacterium]